MGSFLAGWYALGAIVLAIGFLVSRHGTYRTRRLFLTGIAALFLTPMILWAPGDGGMFMPAGLAIVAGVIGALGDLRGGSFDSLNYGSYLLISVLPILIVWAILYTAVPVMEKLARRFSSSTW